MLSVIKSMQLQHKMPMKSAGRESFLQYEMWDAPDAPARDGNCNIMKLLVVCKIDEDEMVLKSNSRARVRRHARWHRKLNRIISRSVVHPMQCICYSMHNLYYIHKLYDLFS